MRGDKKCSLTSNPLPLAGARKKYVELNSHVLGTKVRVPAADYFKYPARLIA